MHASLVLVQKFGCNSRILVYWLHTVVWWWFVLVMSETCLCDVPAEMSLVVVCARIEELSGLRQTSSHYVVPGKLLEQLWMCGVTYCPFSLCVLLQNRNQIWATPSNITDVYSPQLNSTIARKWIYSVGRSRVHSWPVALSAILREHSLQASIVTQSSY